MKNIELNALAEMAELADALVSGTSARKGMGVRLPLSAFFNIPILVESFSRLEIVKAKIHPSTLLKNCSS